MKTHAEVVHAFSPVGKLTQGQQSRMFKVETESKDLATSILDLVPECADRTAALRMLLQVKQMCVQAITHQTPPEVKVAPKPPEPPKVYVDPNPQSEVSLGPKPSNQEKKSEENKNQKPVQKDEKSAVQNAQNG